MTERSLILLLAALLLIVSASPSARAEARLAAIGSANPGPGLTPADEAVLLNALRGAEAHGFHAGAFGFSEAEAALRSDDLGEQARRQVRLKSAVIAYAQAQRGGRLSPNQFRRTWAIRPAPYDAAADFEQALAGNELPAWVAGLPPQEPRYARLVSAYARYREIAAKGGWPVLKVRAPLKAGSAGEQVRALRQRLAIEDPGVAMATATNSAAYDLGLTEAVSRAQARYGLNVDGVAGPSTIAALNIPIERRLGQIRANLERWRWMPRSLPGERVELNIPAAWFDDYENNVPVLSMRAVVGRPSNLTPSFQDHIHAILFYPPWNVPSSIAANELWPKERRDPGYLAREGFRRMPNGRLQQKPGPKNALGLVKFELDDPFAVYFHDTPARSLFAREYRALSHGCMRLEQPYALAKRLLRNTPGWSEARIDAAFKSGVTQRVALPKRVMAYVVYWTVFVDVQGKVHFRPDIYGWDDALLALLDP